MIDGKSFLSPVYGVINMNAQPNIMQTSSEAHSASNDTIQSHDYPEVCQNADSSGILTPSSLAGKYTFLQQIGSGAQGNIYKARNRKTGELVAIKQLRIDQVENWKAYDLFEREAKVLSQLNIPGVAKFYEAMNCLDDDPPCAYIVQELIEGVSLESHLRSGQRWTLSKSFAIAIQILDILEKLHHSNPPVIHRDLKPNNIMICQRDGVEQVYLIDFGAVANPIVQSGGSTVAGTFGYMPPEQLMGKPGPESDIYALAATVVYMLSGVTPADMDTLEFRLVIEPHLQAFPEAVMHVLGRMLEPSVNNRLTDYEVIRQHFEHFSCANFTESDLNIDSFYISKDYMTQFKSIRTLWDNGNLKFWSALPSRTPRYVPDELEKATDVDLHSHRPIIRSQFHSDMKTSGCTKVFATITLVPLLLLILFTGFLTEAGFGAIITVAAIVFPFLGWILWMAWGGGRFEANLKLPVHSPTDTKIYKLRNILLKRGQKTIATIVSIQYKPTNGDPGERWYCEGNPNPDGECEYIHSVPSFIITYKFNPPDDSLSEDLVHRITIHRSPDSHLHPGDPLPIIYSVNPKNKEKVYSMPFPFAMCDVENYADLICATVNGRICDCK